jgi:hypothetical protein
LSDNALLSDNMLSDNIMLSDSILSDNIVLSDNISYFFSWKLHTLTWENPATRFGAASEKLR